ncbi:MAG: RagB/SusD family nutrient uptake outer membrane protein [Alistipes sp.]|nr:RagB/SusD family nutrient uptake outer membrane protein [Alistipes sp.]
MNKYIIILISILSLGVVGCDSYLERQPDEPKTSENIFEKRTTTFQYLTNVYSWINNETDPSGQNNILTPSSDECSCSFGNRWFRLFNNDTWQVSSNPSVSSSTFLAKNYSLYWKGIREATYFMENVHRCPELTEQEVKEWIAEARFLRAYYYFCLMRMWGPVFIHGEACADYTSESLRDMDRNTWDECVDWVAEQCDMAAADLLLEQPDTWLGRATKGAALALKSRLTLYSARPLFNGCPIYKGMKNYYGNDLFPQTEDAQKWVEAAQAAEEVMELGVYQIVGESAGTPYDSWRKVFLERWNKELIFARQNNSYNWRVATTPEGVGGRAYGGVGVTQKLVDAFALENGVYPIEGYEADGQPIIATAALDAGYSETGFSSFTHPILKSTRQTYNMYVGREPRFYMSVFWSGLNWIGGENTIADIQFYKGGNSYTGKSDNYTTTGYLPFKFTSTTYNTKSQSSTNWEPITWPLFRYAEVLLNYAEAVAHCVEAGVGGYTAQDALAAVNRVRTRAGVPALESVYPAAASDMELLAKLILRERQIELNFENHRYFDTRTNLLSEVEDAGNVYGMNVEASSDSATSDYWQRTVIRHDGGNNPSTRVFTKRQYLLPFYQSEVDRLNNLTQNYGW